MRFKDYVAVITGAGSGIGEATACRLAKEGATVILVGRTVQKLERVAANINESANKQRAYCFSADVTNSQDIEQLGAFIEKEFGSLQVLINCAGGSSHSKILEATEEEWDNIQAVNLKSVFLVSKRLASIMVNNDDIRDRSIVNVASLSGYKTGAHIPHYSAAKAAVINFTRALAFELAPHGIRVNSVSPGFAATDLTQNSLKNEKFVKAIERHTALSRVGTSDEMANVIAFAASQEASYMTGSDLLVDGGWLIM